jgi:hypothetical protein
VRTASNGNCCEVVAEHSDHAQVVHIAEHEVGGGAAGGEAVEDPAESRKELIYLVDVVARNLRPELHRVAAADPTQRVAHVIGFPGEIGRGGEVAADGEASRYSVAQFATIDLRGLAIGSESTDYLAEKGESPMPLPPEGGLENHSSSWRVNHSF